MFWFQIKLAGRYLWGRKLRTFLTTLAIVFGTLVIFGMNIILPTMVQAFQSNLLAASGQVDVTVTLKTGEAFSRKVLNRVRAVEGIRAIAGSLSRTVNIPSDYYGRADIAALTLTGIDPKDAQTLRSYPVKEGRFLRSDDTYAAVITTSLAESLGLQLDDELNLPTAEGSAALRIVGLLPARALPGNEEVLMTLYQAQKLLDLPERINTIEANLTTTDEAQRDAIQANIQSLVARITAWEAYRAVRRNPGEHQDRAGGVQPVRFPVADHGRVHHLQYLPHDRGGTAARYRHAALARGKPADDHRLDHDRRIHPGSGRHDHRHHTWLHDGRGTAIYDGTDDEPVHAPGDWSAGGQSRVGRADRGAGRRGNPAGGAVAGLQRGACHATGGAATVHG